MGLFRPTPPASARIEASGRFFEHLGFAMTGKRDFPVNRTRRHLETGPIVLISSAWRGKSNIMTLGWHMMIGWDQVATYIWDANHSFDLIGKSKACVINVPTVDLVDTVVKIGNSSGAKIDKFSEFRLTPVKAAKVSAPLISECYASFECRLSDDSLIASRSLFIWDVVKAHVSPAPKNPRTIHYRGDGAFMVAGETNSRRSMFGPGILKED
jgi:flavin reductase (DIM6/NTAB) family NADH-FMN oxidoreductase RutF